MGGQKGVWDDVVGELEVVKALLSVSPLMIPSDYGINGHNVYIPVHGGRNERLAAFSILVSALLSLNAGAGFR